MIGAFSVMSKWFIFTQLDMSDATVISFSSPFMTMILAHYYINEPFSFIDALTCFIGFIGLLFVARPEFIFNNDSNDNIEDETMQTAN